MNLETLFFSFAAGSAALALVVLVRLHEEIRDQQHRRRFMVLQICSDYCGRAYG